VFLSVLANAVSIDIWPDFETPGINKLRCGLMLSSKDYYSEARAKQSERSAEQSRAALADASLTLFAATHTHTHNYPKSQTSAQKILFISPLLYSPTLLALLELVRRRIVVENVPIWDPSEKLQGV
jgi:hypothetical protein